MKVRISWCNSAGKLDEVVAEEGYDAAVKLVALIEETNVVNVGDIFRVVGIEDDEA